jgi:uncharacterized membrane protein
MPWKELAMGLGTLWLTALSWIAVREINRLDTKADKSQITDLLYRMEVRDAEAREARIEAREARERLYEKIDQTSRTINETAVKVGRLEGRGGGGYPRSRS